jgi:hypothetical protein
MALLFIEYLSNKKASIKLALIGLGLLLIKTDWPLHIIYIIIAPFSSYFYKLF